MIKAEELRIGNWVLTEQCDGTIDKYQITGFDVYKTDENEQHGMLPIPLTEEILLRCGFQGNEDEMHIVLGLGSGEELSVELITDTTCLVRSDPKYNSADYCYIKNIEYLHQLQNLYFALTGKELQFKP